MQAFGGVNQLASRRVPQADIAVQIALGQQAAVRAEGQGDGWLVVRIAVHCPALPGSCLPKQNLAPIVHRCKYAPIRAEESRHHLPPGHSGESPQKFLSGRIP